MELFKNFAADTLNAGINNSVTSLVVNDASLFPATGNFRIKIDSELLLVTAVSTNTFTVTRAIEGSSAASHSGGAAVTLVLTASGLVQGIVDNSALTYARSLASGDTTFSTSGWTDVSGCSLTLAAGTWLLLANIQLRNNGGGTSTGGCKIYYGSTDIIAGEYSIPNGFNAVFTLQATVVLSGTQTVKLAGRGQSGSTFQAKQFGDYDLGAASISGTNFSAIKIA